MIKSKMFGMGAMWLAVVDSTVENGCMRVIAGSHKLHDRRYEDVADKEKNLFGREIIENDIEPSKIVDLELQVGECHFHDAFTIHGSNPNRVRADSGCRPSSVCSRCR